MADVSESDKQKAAKIVEIQAWPVSLKLDTMFPALINRIATALAEQRERCAVIAETNFDGKWEIGYRNGGLMIAAAIRSGNLDVTVLLKTMLPKTIDEARDVLARCGIEVRREPLGYGIVKPGCDPMRTDLRSEQVIWAAAGMVAIEFSEETTDSAAKQKEAQER